MYKITIDLNDWSFGDETMTIETNDFEKIEVIREFIEFQKENGWAADYEQVSIDDEDEDSEYFYDEENDIWYWYDAEADEWVEVELVDDEEEEEEEEEADDQTSDLTVSVLVFETKADKE